MRHRLLPSSWPIKTRSSRVALMTSKTRRPSHRGRGSSLEKEVQYVCQGDLVGCDVVIKEAGETMVRLRQHTSSCADGRWVVSGLLRSEERRVGKECRSRWWRDH